MLVFCFVCMLAFGYITYIPHRETKHVYVNMYIYVYVYVYDVYVFPKTFPLSYKCSIDATLRNIVMHF